MLDHKNDATESSISITEDSPGVYDVINKNLNQNAASSTVKTSDPKHTVVAGVHTQQKLVQTNGDIHAISTIDMASVRPTFGGLYSKFHGLQILIHDIQKTDVSLEKYSTLGNIWTATVEVVIHDNFGLDLHDAVTYQDKHDGFPCW